MAALTYTKEKICLALGSNHTPTETAIIRRLSFKLKCPGSIRDNCKEEEHVWHCSNCKKLILRDLDDNFYCDCGKSKAETFVFKCSSNQHGPEFLSFPPETMKNLYKEIPEVNILVIGVVEKDIAKWLNTFVNSIAFPTMQEAIDGTLISMTPFSSQVIDENDVVHNLTCGTSSNNQMVRANSILMHNRLVRIIDVPGFANCSDVENMKKHFKYLLRYLQDINLLHGICFLPKIGSEFELCFREFLYYFDLNIIENVVFCFTNQKSIKMRIYLAQLLRENKLIISLNETAVYNMYNDCIQYIYAVQEGLKFKDKEFLEQMWKTSVKETNRLVSYFEIIKPHHISLTLSMIEARNTSIYLSQAISIAFETITRNLIQIKRDLEKYKGLEANCIKQSIIKIVPFPTPRIICKNTNCRYFFLDSHPVCHDNCYLDGVTLEFADPKIKNCSCMDNGGSLYCGYCGCFWDQHVMIAFNQTNNSQNVKRTNNSQNVKQNLIPCYLIRDASIYVKEVENEKRKIMENSIRIGKYLTKLSLKSFTDQLLYRMQSSINREQSKDSEFDSNFIAVRDAYIKEERLFCKSNVKDVERNEYDKLLNELYTLESNGKLFKETVELIVDQGQKSKIDILEEFFDLTLLLLRKQ